ncbi:ABC transporter permease [Enterococcus sp. 669A]|uniref:ABC transporter permease n=1 Tax=Candidatus Enterococcus moelleringii TaxID=2815325 RepID=A0ABS3LB74_9ENTE|nr:ABC transporter permease [Enterococcus sp. 669A]MBO1306877.1 ABC transporter permease [Enterococcus sp. 669A]
MFLRMIAYRLKVLLKNRTLLFWTLAFPIALGLLFNFAFGGFDEVGKLETTKVGIVSTDEEKTADFEEVLFSIKNDGTSIYKGQRLSEEKAVKQLAADNISGYYTITPDDITLSVSQTGVAQTILKEFLNQYVQKTAEVESLLASGSIQPQELSQDLFIEGSHVEDIQEADSYSVKSFYFFTLVAVSIMYGFMWGLKNSNDQQANQSANGIRLCLIPKNKLIVAVTNLIASYILFYIQSLIILAVFRFVYQVDFGDRWLYILLIYAIASLTSISFGTLIGNLFTKWTYQQKNSFGIAISMAMSFFAGMMGSQSIKYWIDANLPLLGRLNIVNLISDSMYQLFYYDSLQPFYLNLLWLSGFAVVFVFLNYFFERKAQYEHL